MTKSGSSLRKTRSILIWAIMISLGRPILINATEPTESVVTIYAESNRFGSAQGTGFVFGEGGKIATAYHVVQDATRLEIFDNKRRSMTDIRIERVDPKRDVAVLKVGEAKNLPSL